MNAWTRWLKVAALAGAAIALSGCASSMSGSAYPRAQARQAMEVRMGVVDSVRQVQLDGTESGTGSLAGAIIGGVAGSNVGGGKGAIVATILGAVAGGVAGSAIEENVTKKLGLEITVQLDDGRLLAVTQEADETFRPGDRVRILTGRGGARVSH